MKKNNPDLKVTGITMLPPDYKGEPCILNLELFDKDGGCYESEIHMDAGVDKDKLRDAVYESMIRMDSICIKVHVKSLKIKK